MGWQRAGLSRRTASLLAGNPERALVFLRAVWPAAVGEELARKTELVAVQGPMLRVRVADAAWRKALHRMRRQILDRLREVAGPAAPRQLGFDEGPVRSHLPPRAVAPAPAPPGPPPPEVAAAAESIPDPELREAFLATAARYLERARTQRPSPPDPKESSHA